MSDTIDLAVTVDAVNDAPLFRISQVQGIREDAGLTTITISDVYEGPQNEGAQNLDFSITTQNGDSWYTIKPEVVHNEGDTFALIRFYVPDNRAGSDRWTLTLMDDGGTADNGQNSKILDIELNVGAENDAPVITGQDPISVLEDGAVEIIISMLKVTDVDDDLANLRLSIQGGSNYTNSGNRITPTNNYNGVLAVPVVVIDTTGASSNTYNLIVDVIAVNDAPTLTAPSIERSTEDKGVDSLYITNILMGPTDENGQIFSSLEVMHAKPDNFYLTEPYIVINNSKTEGWIIYEIAPDSSGTDNWHAALKDDGGVQHSGIDSVTFDVTLTIDAVNDDPILSVAGPIYVDEDSTISITKAMVTIVDIDNDDSDITLSLTSGTNYTVNGTLLSPSADFNGNLNVIVTVYDGAGGSDTKQIPVTVRPVNDAPRFTVSDFVGIEDGGQYTIDITDIFEGPVLNELTQKSGFTITRSKDNDWYADTSEVHYNYNDTSATITFTVAADSSGEDTWRILLRDSAGIARNGVDSVVHVITVKIDPQNDAPVITGQKVVSVWEDQKVELTLDSLFVSDKETPNGKLSLVIKTNPGQPYQLHGDTVVPQADYNGNLVVPVEVIDEEGLKATYLMQVTVEAVNDQPYFEPELRLIDIVEDAGVQRIPLKSIHEGRPNEIAQTLTFGIPQIVPDSLVYLSAPKIVYTDGDTMGTLEFTVSDNEVGVDTITITLFDNGTTDRGGIDTYTIRIPVYVGGVNDPPVITAVQPDTVLEDSTITLSRAMLTYYDIDTDVSDIKFMILPDANFDIVDDSILTPISDINGDFTLRAVLEDNEKGKAFVDFVLTVTPVNDAPRFTVSNFSGIEDSGLHTINIQDVFEGPLNELSQASGISIIRTKNDNWYDSIPTIEYDYRNNFGTIHFVGAPDSSGVDTLRILLRDSAGVAHNGVDSVVHEIYITLTPINDKPIFNGQDSLVFLEGGSLAVSRADLNITDIDTDLDAITLKLSNGQFYTIANDTIVIPDSDFNGTLIIPSTIDDHGVGGVVSFDLTVVVDSVNDQPTINVIHDKVINEDSVNVSILIDGLDEGGDVYENHQNLDITIKTTRDSSWYVDYPKVAYVQDNGAVTLLFTVAPDSIGLDTITVMVKDNGTTVNGGMDTVSQWFELTVKPVDDAPVITGQHSVSFPEDHAYTIKESDLIYYDIDTDSLDLVLTIRDSVNYSFVGTTIKPDTNFYGILYVPVIIMDTSGLSDEFIMTITVTAVNDSPSFTVEPRFDRLEDSGLHTIEVKNVSRGPLNERDQILDFAVTTTAPADWFTTVAGPSVRYNSDTSMIYIDYELATDTNGTFELYLRLTDSGISNNTFNHTVVVDYKPVNDSPRWNPLSKIDVKEDSPQWDSLFAIDVTPGPANEAAQYPGMTLLPPQGTKDALWYDEYPTFTLNSNGTVSLTFTPKQNITGEDTLYVTLKDAAGTNNGGNDFVTQRLIIEIGGVNDAPVLDSQKVITVLEDGSVTVTKDSIKIFDPDSDLNLITLTLGDSVNYSVINNVVTPDSNYYGTLYVPITLTDDLNSTSQSVITIEVIPVNDAPSFQMNPLYSVVEDTGMINTSFITSINPGPRESDLVWFQITDIDSVLYSTVPSINSSGDLVFETKPHINGRDTIWVRAKDDGYVRTDSLGIDSSAYQQLILEFLSVNDKPVIITIKSFSVLEDDTLVIRKSDITVVDNDSGDDFTIILKDGTHHTVTDSIFIPAANFYHDIWTDIRVTDGVDTSTSYGIVVDVIPVNDAPSFDMDSQYTIGEDAGRISIPWISNISSGPLEADRVDFHLTVSDLSLFDIKPYINRAGELTFKTDTNVTGSVTIDVYAEDNGGLANGGVNRSGTQSMTLRITAYNDLPYLILVDTLYVLEDSSIVIDGDTLVVRDVDSDSSDVTVIVYDTLWHYEYENILDPSTIDYSVIDTNVTYDTTITVTYDTLINVNPIDTIITTHRDTSYEKQIRIPVDTNDYWKRGNTVFPNDDYNGDMYVRLRAFDGIHYSKYYYDQLLYVIPVNDLPVITQDSFTIFENTTGTIQSIPIYDVDDSLFSITVVDTNSSFYITVDGELAVKDGRGLDFEKKRIHSVVVSVDDAKDSIDIIYDTLTISVENIFEKVTLIIDSVMIDSVIYPGEGTKIYTNSDSVFVYYTVDGTEKSDWNVITPTESDTIQSKIIGVDRWHSDETKDMWGADTVFVHWSTVEPNIIVEGIEGPLDTVFTNDTNYIVRAVVTTLDSNFRIKSEIVSFKPDLNEGVLTPVGVDTTDVYGNYGGVPFFIMLDTTAPNVEIITPRDRSELHQYLAIVDWTIEGTSQDTLNLDTINVGYNTISRCDTDRAGNVGCDSTRVYVNFNSVDVVMEVENDMIDGRNPNAPALDRIISNGEFDSEESYIGVSLVDYSRNEEVEIYSGTNGSIEEVHRDIGQIAVSDELSILNYFEFSDSIVASGSVTVDDVTAIDQKYDTYKAALAQDRKKSTNHVGPTLLLELSVPHMGGSNQSDGAARGGLRLVGTRTQGPNGEMIIDEGDMSWVPLHFATIHIEVYIYDPIGQFVDRMKIPVIKIVKPENINDDGKVAVRVAIKPTVEGLINSVGKKYATGVYLLSAEAKLIVYQYKENSYAEDVDSENDAFYNHGDRIGSNSEYILDKWGYIHSDRWLY
ncbi:MAG: tandem-95 repeat protein [Fibrobacterales bacterium]